MRLINHNLVRNINSPNGYATFRQRRDVQATLRLKTEDGVAISANSAATVSSRTSYSASWMVSRALTLLATVLANCRSTGANSGVDGPDPAESSVLAPHAVGGVILERHLTQAAKPPVLEVLTYDSRRDRKGVYASVRAQGLALRVGKLKGSGARPYHSSDKPTWLLQTLCTRERVM